jgi:CRISPR-associated protein (TIGR02710 family)
MGTNDRPPARGDDLVDHTEQTLLICTVGGSPEPLVVAIKATRPRRVLFVTTKETREQVDSRIVPLARQEGSDLDAGRYNLLELPDAQDLEDILSRLRRLTPQVEDWLGRGEAFKVVVDFTGGTKCMSAALALQAQRWRCVFSYVGGTERTKGGVGVVVSGKEQILHTQNPWDALGFPAVEEFSLLFDRRTYAAATELAERVKRNVSSESRKREFSALGHAASAYDAWDRFDHESSQKHFNNLAKCDNDLDALLGPARSERFRAAARSNADCLERLVNSQAPSLARVADLLANAGRRRDEGRWDDAVARLYRAIEAYAQFRLADDHKISDTAHIALEEIPSPLRETWEGSAEEGMLKLGLQEDYRLLHALENPAGARFRELGLHDRKSPLTARNQSILAHGFVSVGEKPTRQLWQKALELTDISEQELVSFPQLRQP